MNEQLDALRERIIRLARENPKEALAHADKMIESYSEFAISWDTRSYVHMRNKDSENALLDADMAISLQMDEPSNYFHKGEIYFSINDFHNAVICFNEAIDIEEKTGSNYYIDTLRMFRAFCNCKMHNFDIAQFDLNLVSDDGEFWIDKLRTKTELIEICRKKQMQGD